MMLSAAPSLLLKIWEQGSTLHSIDRILLLVTQARADIPTNLVADFSLGFINKTLLQMRFELFGRQMNAVADCCHCHETLDLSLDLQTLLTQLSTTDNDALYSSYVHVNGYRFRLPNSRDLAVISQESDVDVSALHLLQRCCIARPDDEALSIELISAVSTLMEEVEPALDINCNLICDHCGAQNTLPLNIGDYLWREIENYATNLLREVHLLAVNYGWSEQAILAISQQRRQHYLNMVMA